MRQRTAITAFVEVDNVYDRDNLYVYSWSRTLKAPQPILPVGPHAHRRRANRLLSGRPSAVAPSGGAVVHDPHTVAD